MRDYTHLYREELRLGDSWSDQWDIFLSAYNSSARVQEVFAKAPANTKQWLIHNEYGYSTTEHPTGNVFTSAADNEAEFIQEYYSAHLSSVDLASTKFCVDVTGFMRPHMMFLIKLLVLKGLKSFDVIYTEPSYYAKGERTAFSLGSVQTVRQVVGFEGPINNDTSRDLLIIAAGFESTLTAEVADEKEMAEKVILYGFPSLVADMYQQNVWNTSMAADAIGESSAKRVFAPANDPFVTATAISERVAHFNAGGHFTNLYLSPLATKAQALGFVLYYLEECVGKSVSIIYPFSAGYEKETGMGISRIWKYRIELPVFANGGATGGA